MLLLTVTLFLNVVLCWLCYVTDNEFLLKPLHLYEKCKGKFFKSYLRYKTIICNKVAPDVQLVNFLFEEKAFCSRDI